MKFLCVAALRQQFILWEVHPATETRTGHWHRFVHILCPLCMFNWRMGRVVKRALITVLRHALRINVSHSPRRSPFTNVQHRQNCNICPPHLLPPASSLHFYILRVQRVHPRWIDQFKIKKEAHAHVRTFSFTAMATIELPT
jgi:hypothetical protein